MKILLLEPFQLRIVPPFRAYLMCWFRSKIQLTPGHVYETSLPESRSSSRNGSELKRSQAQDAAAAYLELENTQRGITVVLRYKAILHALC